MIREILLTAGAVLAAAFLLGLGICLGRWSRRDEIDTLGYRIAQHESTIGDHIAYEDRIEAMRTAEDAAAAKEIAQITGDLARERDVSAHLRGLLAERQGPVWSQLNAVEPPPIDKEWLRWEGSEAGHTGAWRIAPGEVPEPVHEGVVLDRGGVTVLPASRALVPTRTYPAKKKRGRH